MTSSPRVNPLTRPKNLLLLRSQPSRISTPCLLPSFPPASLLPCLPPSFPPCLSVSPPPPPTPPPFVFLPPLSLSPSSFTLSSLSPSFSLFLSLFSGQYFRWSKKKLSLLDPFIRSLLPAPFLCVCYTAVVLTWNPQEKEIGLSGFRPEPPTGVLLWFLCVTCKEFLLLSVWSQHWKFFSGTSGWPAAGGNLTVTPPRLILILFHSDCYSPGAVLLVVCRK